MNVQLACIFKRFLLSKTFVKSALFNHNLRFMIDQFVETDETEVHSRSISKNPDLIINRLEVSNGSNGWIKPLPSEKVNKALRAYHLKVNSSPKSLKDLSKMKVWRASLGILVGANLENDWYFEPGFNVTLETTKGKV